MKEFELDKEGFMPVKSKTGRVIKLAMQDVFLTGKILAVGARLFVRHTFKSGEKKPLEVIYTFILPRDAALRRFRIKGEGFDVKSQLKPLKEASLGLARHTSPKVSRPVVGFSFLNCSVALFPGLEGTSCSIATDS